MHVIHHAQLKTSCSLSKEDMDISMLQDILFLSAQSAVICLAECATVSAAIIGATAGSAI